MGKVFVSYRHGSESRNKRIREFVERLIALRFDVLFDDPLSKQGGPDSTWHEWSYNAARNTERVLIAGSAEWFQIANMSTPPANVRWTPAFGQDCEKLSDSGHVWGGIGFVLGGRLRKGLCTAF